MFSRRPKKLYVDRPLLVLVSVLVVCGFLIFLSAVQSLQVRESVSVVKKLVFNQTLFGLFMGGVAMIITSNIKYTFWQRYAVVLYIAALSLTAAVFIPGFGLTAGGATRWLDLQVLTLQPAEFLKIGVVLLVAAWIAGKKRKFRSFQNGILPLLMWLGIAAIILLKQPDNGTLFVSAGVVGCLFIIGGARWKHIGALMLLGLCFGGVLIASQSYVRDRIVTFINPSEDSLGSSYQVQQSLIAVGSGGILGRGPGRSVQKFSYLPEPYGDSIFAVLAEELGFVGATALIGLYLAFLWRVFLVASRVPDLFGRLVACGIALSITLQSFLNIASMIGLFPLSGMPLLFVSHGGTALMVTLAAVGVILNISKYQKRSRA